MNRKYRLVLKAMLLFVICSLLNSVFAANEDEFKIDDLKEYQLIKVLGDNLGLQRPQGMALMNNNLIVADSGNNRLLILDASGQIVKVIGHTGSGIGEFVNPTGVAIDNENYIYVVDSGNGRVQKLNSDGSFVQEYVINDFKNIYKNKNNIKDAQNEYGYISDIVIDSNVIYLSTKSYYKDLAHLYYVNMKDNSIKKTYDTMYGFLTKAPGSVYLAWGLDKSFFLNFLVEIKQNTIYYLNLPDDYCPKGLCYNDHSLYIISGNFLTVDKFDLKGNYLGTVFHGTPGMTYLTIDANQNIYISDAVKNCIYILGRDTK